MSSLTLFLILVPDVSVHFVGYGAPEHLVQQLFFDAFIDTIGVVANIRAPTRFFALKIKGNRAVLVPYYTEQGLFILHGSA
jgi:hypothetical protein